MPGIRLMDFSPEAEAYDNRFPAIAKVILRKGAVEFNPVIPSADITLLTTTAAIVVRNDMHPALVNLLTQAVISNPRPAFDKRGRAGAVLSVGGLSFDQRPGVPGLKGDAGNLQERGIAARPAAPGSAERENGNPVLVHRFRAFAMPRRAC